MCFLVKGKLGVVKWDPRHKLKARRHAAKSGVTFRKGQH
jgi:hypothetical protein